MVDLWDSDSLTPYVVVVNDATTPTIGANLQLDNERTAWEPHGAVLNEDGTQFLFCWGRNHIFDTPTDNTAQSVVVYVDPSDSYSLSKSDTVQTSGDVFADHVVCAAYGTSGYAVTFWQDEDDNQAMGTVLLAGG